MLFVEMWRLTAKLEPLRMQPITDVTQTMRPSRWIRDYLAIRPTMRTPSVVRVHVDIACFPARRDFDLRML